MRRAIPAQAKKPRRPFRPALEALEDRLAPAILPPNFSEATVAAELTAATAMELSPDGKLFITEQAGTLEVWRNNARQQANFFANTPLTAYNPNTDTGLVDSRGERGLLGVAFDPGFATNRFVYAYYTYAVNPDGNTSTPTTFRNRVVRFTANAAGDLALAGSQLVILELDNLSGATNHNGGAIHFGPDGKLYVAVGDNATRANAQSLNTRHGKILRINADGSIPGDNPFFNTATGANRAIWALGLRNPYTFTFQPGTGRMHINDVGETTWEEINVGAAGANYGWPDTEGDFNQASFPNYTRPLYAYSHGSGTFQGFAITGGAFYDPAAPGEFRFPAAYAGDYFFADFVNDWINVRDASTGTVTRFATDAAGAVDLRVAADGALFYLARGEGRAYRVLYNPPTPAVQVVDDGDASFVTTGNWERYTGGVGHRGDFAYSPSGTGADVASWGFGVAPGQYRVSATWVDRPNRATNAPYTISDDSAALTTVRVNQRLAPNDFSEEGTFWENLATVTITSGTLLVQLSDDADSEYVIADAIRIERIGDAPQGPEIKVEDGSTDVVDGGSVSFGTATVGAPLSKIFTVRNAGTSTLTLGTPITVPAGFTVTSGFGSTSLAPGASTTFTVRLDAAAAGDYSGQLSFTNNDGDESPYNFAVSGTVTTNAPPAVQVIDDRDAGFSTTGNWDTYGGLGHAGDFTYSPTGTGADVATWTFTVTPGQYRVSATWIERPNRATNAPYTLLDGATALSTVRVNQRQAPNDFTADGTAWEDLATVTITGNTLTVRLSDDADSDYVIADAIRIERIG